MTTVSNKGRSFRSCSESVLWRGRTGDAFESPFPFPAARINRGPVRCLVKIATRQTKNRMTAPMLSKTTFDPKCVPPDETEDDPASVTVML